MARRATYFFDTYKSTSPRLLVSGGWEFMNPNGDKPTQQVINGLAKAFNLMKYDVGLLAQGEADAIGQTSLSLDTSRKTAEIEPFVIITTSTGDQIGFIRLPSLPNGEDIPTKEMIKKISMTVKREQAKVKLLVALSDWGWIGEREYLGQAPQFVPDLLLGSGYGSGVGGRITADGRCFWVRPYDKGRTLNEIDILKWPERSTQFAWKELKNVKSLSIGLGERYKDNPDVSAILH